MHSVDILVDSLRHELQQYGEALALLEEQQELIVQRAAGGVMNSVAAVQTQAHQLLVAREQRASLQKELAHELRLAEDATLADLILRLPPQYQPLVQSLLEENNQLLFKVRQRAKQNHVLLNRSLELMQSLIRSLLPAGAGVVYTAGGDLATPVFDREPNFQAIG